MIGIILSTSISRNPKVPFKSLSILSVIIIKNDDPFRKLFMDFLYFPTNKGRLLFKIKFLIDCPSISIESREVVLAREARLTEEAKCRAEEAKSRTGVAEPQAKAKRKRTRP